MHRLQYGFWRAEGPANPSGAAWFEALRTLSPLPLGKVLPLTNSEQVCIQITCVLISSEYDLDNPIVLLCVCSFTRTPLF